MSCLPVGMLRATTASGGARALSLAARHCGATEVSLVCALCEVHGHVCQSVKKIHGPTRGGHPSVSNYLL